MSNAQAEKKLRSEPVFPTYVMAFIMAVVAAMGWFVFFPAEKDRRKQQHYNYCKVQMEMLKMQAQVLQEFLAVSKDLPAHVRLPTHKVYALLRSKYVQALESYARDIAFYQFTVSDESDLPEGAEPLPRVTDLFLPPEDIP